MNWYITKLVFEIVNNSPNHQFDIQWRLVKANEMVEAIEKANEIALEEENEIFKNTDNHKVFWKFLAIESIQQLPDLENGTELFSQIIEHKNPTSFLDNLFIKHQDIVTQLQVVSV